LAEDAINWLRTHKAVHPDKPFYLYWASGAIHGPHHVHREWVVRPTSSVPSNRPPFY
jgi:arylsulfatase